MRTFEIVEVSIVALAVFLPGTTIGFLAKERARRAIRARFAYFLPPALIGRIEANPEAAQPWDQKGYRMPGGDAKHPKMAQILVDEYGGQVPSSRAALQSLPGVGRKTANVVLNTAFGKPTMAVDTHIFRVANRTGIAPGKNVNEVEKRLLRLVPKEFLQDAHHWLILHGRYTCIARKPRCGSCTISELCEYKKKNLD